MTQRLEKARMEGVGDGSKKTKLHEVCLEASINFMTIYMTGCNVLTFLVLDKIPRGKQNIGSNVLTEFGCLWTLADDEVVSLACTCVLESQYGPVTWGATFPHTPHWLTRLDHCCRLQQSPRQQPYSPTRNNIVKMV